MKTARKIAAVITALFIAGSMPLNAEDRIVESGELTEMDFLRADGRDLRNSHGELINLRGTNVGGYLLQEFWMTPTSYGAGANAEEDVYRVLAERFGEETMFELVDLYQANYFTEQDMDNCAAMGMNVLRLPFWWRNLVDEAGTFYPNNETHDPDDPFGNAFRYIDRFVAEAGKRGMYVILDMHGAPGSQSGSDHSGKDGGNNKEAASEFFFGPDADANQALFYRIWEVIAERYRGNPVIAGYDLLNEPFCTYRYNSRLGAAGLHSALWPVYDEAYRRIRAIDPDHIIIMEATWDPSDLPHPSVYGWTNVMYQYHNYAQGSISNLNNAAAVTEHMQNKLNLITSAAYDVPSYMGEFNYYGNMATWEQGLALFNGLGISWTTWTYKTTPENGSWGLYHHLSNNRVNLHTASLDDIRDRWERSGLSNPNTRLVDVVSKYCRAPVTANKMAPQPADLAEGAYFLTGYNTKKIVTVDAGTLALSSSGASYTAADEQLFTLTGNDDGTFSFQSKLNGKYVSVDPSTKRLRADADAIGDDERFDIQQLGLQFTLTSPVSGQYVCSDENAAGAPLIANRGAANAWEQFLITPFDLVEPAEPPGGAEQAQTTPDGGGSTPSPQSIPEAGDDDTPERKLNPAVFAVLGGIAAIGISVFLYIRSRRNRPGRSSD